MRKINQFITEKIAIPLWAVILTMFALIMNVVVMTTDLLRK